LCLRFKDTYIEKVLDVLLKNKALRGALSEYVSFVSNGTLSAKYKKTKHNNIAQDNLR